MISVTNLTKKFDEFTALDSVDIEIKEGVIYGVVGSNGAGKSTLLRLMSGVYQPDNGEILIDDKKVWENPEVKENIAYIPDDLYLQNGVSMDSMARLHGAIYNNFDKKRFNELAELFKLDTKKSLNTFSKGMKRQVVIILALSRHPKYMFFDETFDGLDPVIRALVKKLISQEILEKKATVILTSHSLRDLEETCDQLALLHKGGIVFESDIYNIKTSLFKVQVAFEEKYEESDFNDLDIMNYKKNGSVINMIVKGDREKVRELLNSKTPLVLDILPLTLEEVFTYEMSMLGYSFDDILKGGEENE